MKTSLIYYPQLICKKKINFRMCNNYLPIEKLRWAGIDRDHRKCNLCDKRDIGDEFHYLLSCSFFANTRRGMLPSCYLQHPNYIVFKKVLNEKDELKLTNMQTYLCHTEAISKSTRQLIMCLCIFFLLFLISIHWWFTIMYYFYAYSKFVFMSLTDIPLYLVLYTFGTYLYFVFVYMDVFCVFCCFYTPTHTAWCFSYNNLFVFPHYTCNVLSVLNNWNWEIKGVTF